MYFLHEHKRGGKNIENSQRIPIIFFPQESMKFYVGK